MSTETVPYGRKTQKASPVAEVHILWITAGLGCDGDSVSITAATQPSIEDVVLGAIPGLPKVHLHNPVLAYENGDDFMKYLVPWRSKASSILSFWWSKARFPTRRSRRKATGRRSEPIPTTGQPITTNEWIDRLAPKALAVVARGTCATYGGIHAMEGNPTGCMGLADYLGWDWQSKAGLPIVNVPGCPVQPDNFMETLLYLLYQVAGLAPMIPLDDQLRPTWLFGKTVHEGCDRAGYYEQGDFAESYGSSEVHRQAGLLGSGGELQRAQARLDGRHRRLPQRRRHLHRLHHAGLPRQVHAVHGRAAGRAEFRRGTIGVYGRAIRALRSLHQPHGQQGAEVAASAAGTDHRLPARSRTDGDGAITMSAHARSPRQRRRAKREIWWR